MSDDTDVAGDGQPVLRAALKYIERGWTVIPLPYRSKNLGRKGWERLRLQLDELSAHFGAQEQNLGVLLGEPSGWLIDVDLDHPRAVELAPDYLPPTPTVFGRGGKQRSHWLYRVTAPVATRKFRSRSAGMIVELRSTGTQTVFPPSVHESGEEIFWEDSSAEPAEVDPEGLLECVKQLAAEVKRELGEQAAARTKRPPQERAGASAHPPVAVPPLDRRAQQSLRAMLRIGTTDGQDGSFRLFVAACRAVEYDLDDATAVATIEQYAGQRPFPRQWTATEILQRVRDAELKCQRGRA